MAQQRAYGPSSSIGIVRFFDTEISGAKLTPEFVVSLAFIFVALIMLIRFLGLAS